MSKAKLIETVERDGHQIAIYESGAEYDMTDKHLVKWPKSAQITSQNAHVYIRRRQEKAAALLRERIRQRHSAGDMTPVRSSAEAFAESGALLYEEVVLSPDAYPRDRLETWEKLGKYAGVLPSDIRKPDDGLPPAGAATALAAGAAAAVLKFLSDVAERQRSRADVIDIRNENDGNE